LWKHDGIFVSKEEEGLKQLATAMKAAHWEDHNAAQILEIFAESFRGRPALNLSSVSRWVLSHPNNAEAVKSCMAIDPPENIFAWSAETVGEFIGFGKAS
jgi:hypothetical protein